MCVEGCEVMRSKLVLHSKDLLAAMIAARIGYKNLDDANSYRRLLVKLAVLVVGR